MYEQRYNDQLDEVTDVARNLKTKIGTINTEVNEQGRTMDKMRVELEETKKNMDSIHGHFENLMKAIGRLCLSRRRDVAQYD